MFWEFDYEPKVNETEIKTVTETETVNASGTRTYTTVTATTTQVDVSTNWGDIAQLCVTLLLCYSICLVASKVATFWKRG